LGDETDPNAEEWLDKLKNFWYNIIIEKNWIKILRGEI
jgi:hypothetical protein